MLAYRFDAKGGVEFLLITSRKRGRWTIPKGVVGLKLNSRATARIEAQEEAGISGRLSREPVGTYTHRKWYATCRVRVYLMQVTTQDAVWPERSMRDRKWFRAQGALEALERKSLRKLVKDALPKISRPVRGR